MEGEIGHGGSLGGVTVLFQAWLRRTPNTITQNVGSFGFVSGVPAGGSRHTQGGAGRPQGRSQRELARPSITGVTVSKPLNPSEPQFPHRLGGSIAMASSG